MNFLFDTPKVAIEKKPTVKSKNIKIFSVEVLSKIKIRDNRSFDFIFYIKLLSCFIYFR